jgi:hypothetical protein
MLVWLMTEAACRKLTGVRLKADGGAALVAAMQDSPHPEIELESSRATMPVRDVTLPAAGPAAGEAGEQ